MPFPTSGSVFGGFLRYVSEVKTCLRARMRRKIGDVVDLPQGLSVSFDGTLVEDEFQYHKNNSSTDQAANEIS